MKITRVVLQGESGEEMTLDAAPFYLECSVGRCEVHGSDAGIAGFCDSCRRFVCADHWSDAAGKCEICAPEKTP